ncbi:shikimate kinase [Aureimonas sp. SA4125]|uniref:shikimate kinase n=1 Tax=Aureimonas sp. SA4125 TaxID=2826993 RepID=UPI001CC7B487|nr:shikimate kinase [Aureimonas sp. SA4125]BDA86116.1 shikimate kinase [Aureimonas sp. SA4125]
MRSETRLDDNLDIATRLGGRCITLIGLMGAGKSTVGRKLSQMLALPFHDTDTEIETAAQMSVAELFASYGEPEFRALEARVVARLAREGPHVLATGGGAYMATETREILRERAVTVWLKADVDVLMDRVQRRGNRPLLAAADPRAVMLSLIDKRYPVYAAADITIVSRNVRREVIAEEIIAALDRFLPGDPA